MTMHKALHLRDCLNSTYEEKKKKKKKDAPELKIACKHEYEDQRTISKWAKKEYFRKFIMPNWSTVTRKQKWEEYFKRKTGEISQEDLNILMKGKP